MTQPARRGVRRGARIGGRRRAGRRARVRRAWPPSTRRCARARWWSTAAIADGMRFFGEKAARDALTGLVTNDVARARARPGLVRARR